MTIEVVMRFKKSVNKKWIVEMINQNDFKELRKECTLVIHDNVQRIGD